MSVMGLLGAATLVLQLQASDLAVTNQRLLYGLELGLEYSVTNHLGLAVSFRKEGILNNEGYWISGSVLLQQPLTRSRRSSLMFAAGAEWGLPGSEYSWYQASHDAGGRLINQRWVYSVQNAGETTINPFAGLAISHSIAGPVSIRSGVRLRLIEFVDQEAQRDETSGLLVSVRDGKSHKPIPTFIVAITIRF